MPEYRAREAGREVGDSALGAAQEDLAEAEAQDSEGWWSDLVREAGATKDFGVRALSLEYTFDTRGWNTANLTGSAPLPYHWSLFGFIDLASTDGGSDAEREDISRFFFEVNLKRKLWRDFGVVCEVNDLTGDQNAVGRVGAFYLADSDWRARNDIFLLLQVFPSRPMAMAGRSALSTRSSFRI